MLPCERLGVPLVRFARCERPAEDRFPGIRPAVPDRFVGALALIGREQVRKGESDDCPGGVLFIPAAICPEHRVDLGIAGVGEPEATMPCRRMAHDSVGVDGGALRRTPWRAAGHPDGLAGQEPEFAAVSGLFDHAVAEIGFALDRAVVRIEIIAL